MTAETNKNVRIFPDERDRSASGQIYSLDEEKFVDDDGYRFSLPQKVKKRW